MNKHKRADRLLIVTMGIGLISAALLGGVCLLALCRALEPSTGMVVVNAIGIVGLMAACVVGSVLDGGARGE